MKLEAFVTFALDYFLEKVQEQGVDANTRHTTSEQLVFIYNESLTSTDKEQGLEFSMALFRRNLLKLKVLQTFRSPAEAMFKMVENRINYGLMPLERCIAEKPDVADVINWCQEYTRNRPDQSLAKKKARLPAAVQQRHPSNQLAQQPDLEAMGEPTVAVLKSRPVQACQLLRALAARLPGRQELLLRRSRFNHGPQSWGSAAPCSARSAACSHGVQAEPEPRHG